MPKLFEKSLEWVAENFRKDPSKMLIWTGVFGWSLSSVAQIGAILFNPKISNDKKSFLVPQEMADALTNIGAFFILTQTVKKTASKLFSTGKIAPKSVRNFLNSKKDIYGDKIGKLDFDLDTILKDGTQIKDTYETYKSLGTTISTVGAGILATNIVTPLIRNKMASNMQKNYLQAKQAEIQRQNIYKSSGNGVKI